MRYQGRLWDAPAFDDAVEADLVGQTCVMCPDPILAGEDACRTPVGQDYHLECWLRPVLGDVQHLERRCLCFRGRGNELVLDSDTHATYRDSARATLQWLLDHQQGRFVAGF